VEIALTQDGSLMHRLRSSLEWIISGGGSIEQLFHYADSMSVLHYWFTGFTAWCIRSCSVEFLSVTWSRQCRVSFLASYFL